jgi:ribosomal protein S18 acetylase RimI-like enzyme
MEHQIVIRKAEPPDAPDFKRLIDAIIDDTTPSIETIAELFNDNCREVVYLAFDGVELVGLCTAQILMTACYADPYVEMTELYVVETHRRQGIARRLIQSTETACVERGAFCFRMDVDRDNSIALPLYYSLGYLDSTQFQMYKEVQGSATPQNKPVL